MLQRGWLAIHMMLSYGRHEPRQADDSRMKEKLVLPTRDHLIRFKIFHDTSVSWCFLLLELWLI